MTRPTPTTEAGEARCVHETALMREGRAAELVKSKITIARRIAARDRARSNAHAD